jgi:hypothetical protein
MDKQIGMITSADWTNIDQVRQVTSTALDEFTRPGAIQELLDNFLYDSRLADLSSSRNWGDRFVLFDDPGSGVRIRLHRYHERVVDPPHSHRWTFTSRVLTGGYTHWLYGAESRMVESLEAHGRIPSATLVREEIASHGYTIDSAVVHAIRVRQGTMSLIVHGPKINDATVQVFSGEAGLTWTVGRPPKTGIAPPEPPIEKHRVQEALKFAHRTGVA